MPQSDRLLAALERLLLIEASELRPALDQASLIAAEVLSAEKCDVFVYGAETDSLIALGTSDTPMGREQRRSGLHLQPISNNGPIVAVFESGASYRTGHADQDPTQPRGFTERLGIRSELDCVLDVAGERRGVVHVASSTIEHFAEADLRFLEAVARWIGMIMHRTELFEQLRESNYQEGRRAGSEELIGLLTPRQQQVAALIASGFSNRQIAERLVLGEGTVANHVRAILDRLGAERRSQVAAWIAEGKGLPDQH